MENKVLLGVVLCCVLGTAYATKVSKIEYVGCKRIEQETVETYFPIQVGDDCDSDTINEALKALNKTGFFEDVNIEMEGSVLKVHVKEFPIINKVSFEGNSKLSDKNIKKAVKLNSRETLSPAKIKEIQQVLLETYRKMGRYNASVNPKVIKLSDNRVNLVFEINEGDAAGIGKIVFVGNNQVSSSELRDVMYSKVKRWYRFFVNDDIYDADRMLEDKQAITKYYHDNGYADARVLSAVAELSPDKREFVLTFTIDEGDIYTLDNVSVNSRIPGVSGKELTEDLYCRQGDVYNEALIELDIKAISRAVSKSGFSAVRVSPQTVKNPSKKTVNIVYDVDEGERIYISKIVIHGNTKTRDNVIRREILLEEGDVYNQSFVTMAENRLRELGFFEKVDIQTIPDPNSPDKCILQVTVSEASTAEASVNAAYSTTDGFGIELSYKEENFFGTGKGLSVFLGSSKTSSGKSREVGADGKLKKVSRKERFRFLNNVQVSVTEPHVFDTDIEGTIGGHRYVTSLFDGFNIKEIGGTCSISYELSSKFYQSWGYEASSRKFDGVDMTSSPIIRQQVFSNPEKAKEGKCGISSLRHTIGYKDLFIRGLRSKLNVSLSTSVAGLGGKARHLKNELSAVYNIPVFKKSSLTLSASTGLLSKVGGRDPHIIDSFMLGNESFRGFEMSGMGPFSSTVREIDGKKTTRRDFIGAKKYWKGTVEYTFPLGLPEELQFRGFVFSDFGMLWDAPDKGKKYLKRTGGTVVDQAGVSHDAVSYTYDSSVKGHKILDNKKFRQSVGFGISFMFITGPVSLTYAIPVRKEKYDEQQRFLLGASTKF